MARTSGITWVIIRRLSIRRPRSTATSCNVTVVSPTERWNVCVFCRHLSTRAVFSAWSIATVSRWATPYRPAVTIYGMICWCHVQSVMSQWCLILRTPGSFLSQTVVDRCWYCKYNTVSLSLSGPSETLCNSWCAILYKSNYIYKLFKWSNVN